MIAADGNHSAVRDRALKQHQQFGGARADVTHHYAQLALVALENTITGYQPFVHGVSDFDPGAVGGGDHRLGHDTLRGDHVHLRLELGGEHAVGVANSALVV